MNKTEKAKEFAEANFRRHCKIKSGFQEGIIVGYYIKFEAGVLIKQTNITKNMDAYSTQVKVLLPQIKLLKKEAVCFIKYTDFDPEDRLFYAELDSLILMPSKNELTQLMAALEL